MNIVTNAFVYLGSNIISAFVPFLLIPALTRILTPAEYGVIAIFEASVAILGVLVGLNVQGAVGVRFYRESAETFPRYIGTCFTILFISIIILLLIISAFQIDFGNAIGLPVEVIMIAVFCAALQFVANIRLTLWQVKGDAIKYGIFQIGQAGLNGLFTLLLVLFFSYGAYGRIAGFSVALFVCGAIALYSLVQSGLIVWSADRSDFRDAIKFGLPLIPHAIGGLVVIYADRYVIQNQMGMEATGLYFVAMQLAMPLLLLGTSINRAFVPWLYDKLNHGENLLAVTASYIWIAFTLLVGLLYSAIVFFGLPEVLGERFIGARSVVIILVVGTTFQSAYYAVVNYLFYIKKTGVLSSITFLTCILQICGMYLLAPDFGMIGVAFVFAAVQVIMFFLVWLASAKINPQPWLRWQIIASLIKHYQKSLKIKWH